eukprot:7170858-Pyramimonas_sp.AAC.1
MWGSYRLWTRRSAAGRLERGLNQLTTPSPGHPGLSSHASSSQRTHPPTPWPDVFPGPLRAL